MTEMTSLKKRKFSCPLCKNEFEALALVSTNTFGGIDSEFRTYARGTQPWKHAIHACPSCHYAGKFYPGLDLGERAGAIRNALADLETEGVVKQGSEPDPGTMYRIAARIALAERGDHLGAGDLYLKAAWMADDKGDGDRARSMRLLAAENVESALSLDEVEPDALPPVTYLAGEIRRRLGMFSEALAMFDRFDRLGSSDARLVALCVAQRKMAAEMSDGKAMMADPRGDQGEGQE